MQAEAPVDDRGYLRRALLAIGLFSLVVTGVHAGADQLDDLLFELVSSLDRLSDRALARLIPAIGDVLSVTPALIEEWTFRALDALDVDRKLALARVLALALEGLAGLVLALPLLDPRTPRATVARVVDAARGSLRDPTVLSWVAPFAVCAAAVAGSLVVITEVEAIFGGLGPARVARALALLLGAWVLVTLGLRGAARASVRARALAEQDRVRPPLKRRLRGLVTGLLSAPLALLGAIAAFDRLGALVAPWVDR